jgi:hypothetical protein
VGFRDLTGLGSRPRPSRPSPSSLAAAQRCSRSRQRGRRGGHLGGCGDIAGCSGPAIFCAGCARGSGLGVRGAVLGQIAGKLNGCGWAPADESASRREGLMGRPTLMGGADGKAKVWVKGEEGVVWAKALGQETRQRVRVARPHSLVLGSPPLRSCCPAAGCSSCPAAATCCSGSPAAGTAGTAMSCAMTSSSDAVSQALLLPSPSSYDEDDDMPAAAAALRSFGWPLLTAPSRSAQQLGGPVPWAGSRRGSWPGDGWVTGASGILGKGWGSGANGNESSEGGGWLRLD